MPDGKKNAKQFFIECRVALLRLGEFSGEEC